MGNQRIEIILLRRAVFLLMSKATKKACMKLVEPPPASVIFRNDSGTLPQRPQRSRCLLVLDCAAKIPIIWPPSVFSRSAHNVKHSFVFRDKS